MPLGNGDKRRMKAVVLSIATAVALINAMPASAGPEPLNTTDSKVVTQPPVEEKACRWTGFYLGGHGGYGWGDLSFRELDETDPPYLFEQDGFFGGGQAGFNLQLGSFFVLGVEGTFSAGDFDDSADIRAGGERSRGHVDSDWVATAAGRVGFSFWHNRMLAYAKGGVAFTQFDYHTQELGGSEVFDADEDRTVPLVGFGLEYAFNCHWSVKLEYNHLFFDAEDVTGIERTGGGAGLERTFRSDIDGRNTVQAGINFKF